MGFNSGFKGLNTNLKMYNTLRLKPGPLPEYGESGTVLSGTFYIRNMWVGFIWLRIGQGNETSGSIKFLV